MQRPTFHTSRLAPFLCLKGCFSFFFTPSCKKEEQEINFLFAPFCFLNRLGLQQSPTASSPFVLKGSRFPLGPFVQTISRQNSTQCQAKNIAGSFFLLFFPISLKLSSNRLVFNGHQKLRVFIFLFLYFKNVGAAWREYLCKTKTKIYSPF